MKKWLLLLPLTVLFACTNTEPESETDDDLTTESANTEDEEVSDKEQYRMLLEAAGVATKTAVVYDFKFGEPQQFGHQVYMTTYDTRGNKIDSLGYDGLKISEALVYNDDNRLIERILYDSAKTVLQHLSREINDAGNETAFYYFNENDEVTYSEKRVYDDFDRLIKLTKYDEQGNDYGAVAYAYNENNDVTEMTEMVTEDEILIKSVTSYNEQGWKTGISVYDGRGLLIEKTVFSEHTADGKITKGEKFENGGDSLVVSFTMEYDEDGNELRFIEKNGFNNIVQRAESEYDENGNRIMYAVYGAYGELLGKDEIKYDEAGNKTQTKVIGSAGTQASRLTWKYDENGLLLEETYFDNIDEPQYKVVYEYTYHDPS